MNFFEQCKQCLVRVDGGSGVLFQPMTGEYSYILTAKHNLYDGTEEKNINDIQFILYDESETRNILAKFEHSTLDIAILKIDYINFESPYKQSTEPQDGNEFKFYGYPENIREETNKIKYFDLKVGDISTQEIVAENQSYYDQNDVVGCSGGGVFRQDTDSFYLAGIECRMDAQSTSEENNTRLRFIFIEAFDEIIESSSDELVPLYPPYMNDFNLLVNNIFMLNGMEEAEKILIQDRLKFIARNLSNKLKPIDIKNRFELLESDCNNNHYINNELWSMYLEFMVISIFVDLHTPIDISAIDIINKKRKFLFLKANDWKEEKEHILTSNFSSLEKSGTVIVCCDGDRTPTSCIINNQTLMNIGNGIMSEDFNISRGVDSPHKDFKFKHIHSIQKQMIDDCDNGDEIFNGATASNIEGIIKNEINKIFN